MDALGIEKAVVAGVDWGARTADIVAALWPERCAGLVSVSGYLIGSHHAGELPLAPEAERACSMYSTGLDKLEGQPGSSVRGREMRGRIRHFHLGLS